MLITRFAPSPTGLMHVGSVRPLLINYLYALKNNGKFLLRIDDTDLTRCTDYYKQEVINDINWLGAKPAAIFYQSQRFDRYNEIFQSLLKIGRIYECFETQQELEIKRKAQLNAKKPPVYDRAALKLSDEKRQEYKQQGRKPHYRFLLNHETISWNDLIKKECTYDLSSISDPILVRENGTFTYILCSVVDDIDYKITNIFRGDDHITNTAVQIQIFHALNAPLPQFGHFGLIKAKDEKISKRTGGFEIQTLRKQGVEAMTINSFFTYIGTSKPVVATKTLQAIAQDFEIESFSSNTTTYMPQEVKILNHKLLLQMNYEDVVKKFDAFDLPEFNLPEISKEFWEVIKPNLNNLLELKTWWSICKEKKNLNTNKTELKLDAEILKHAKELLPEGGITKETWGVWTKKISERTGKKGKELYIPLRVALTGMEKGPEMQHLLPMIDRDVIISRLTLN